MIDGIEAYYQRVADSIVESIHDEWVEARVDAVFYSDGITFLGEYTRADGVLRSFETGRSGDKALRELRSRFKDARQPVWGQAHFELCADGKFNMRFGYENCDSNGDTVFDEDRYVQMVEERHKRLTKPSAE